MEESKELQKLYGFMQAFIYITVCIEILLFGGCKLNCVSKE